MTISELGSIGELAAAVATIATLFYLALQIRQNTTALDHATGRAMAEDADQWRGRVIENPEVAALYRTGLTQPDSLDADERLRFRMLMDSLFFGWQYQFAYGLPLSATHTFVKPTLDRPGGAQYWAEARHQFEPNFIEFIEGLNAASDEPG